MPYPRQLELDKERLDELISWSNTELTNHLAERGDWVAQKLKWQVDYNAEPSEKEGTYPFKGASTIITPLTAIAVEATFSRTYQTLGPSEKKIAAQVYTEEQAVIEPALEEYLNQELFVQSDIKLGMRDALLESHKLGTGVGVAEWEKRTRQGVRYKGGKEVNFEVIEFEGNKVSSVPLVNFFMPFECQDPQTARWCGKVFWWTPEELRRAEHDGMVKEGIYNELKGYYQSFNSTKEADYQDQLNKQNKKEPVWPHRLEFFEIYTAWDVDGDGPKEVCYLYHMDSQTIVSMWYNWYEDLRRPYRICVYFPLEFRWDGIGIGKQTELFQEHITAIHRQRLDNGTIANLRMFKINRNATEIEPDEPLFPGKLWFVEDMDDIQSMEMGDVKVSAYNNANDIELMAQKRNGVSELTLGMPGIGTPGTATDSSARMQEASRKFDFTYSNSRSFADQLIQDSLCNIVQFGPNKQRLVQLEHGSELELFLKQPYEFFRKKIVCSVGIVSQNQNQMLDRQNATQVSGLLTQFYTSMLQLASQSQDPALIQQTVKTAMEGGNRAIVQLLGYHGIRNPDQYTINLNAGQIQPPQPIAGGQGGSASASPNNTFNNSSLLAPNLTSILPAQAGGY